MELRVLGPRVWAQGDRNNQQQIIFPHATVQCNAGSIYGGSDFWAKTIFVPVFKGHSPASNNKFSSGCSGSQGGLRSDLKLVSPKLHPR